jgi:hypothetical protein
MRRLDDEVRKVLGEALEAGGWNVFENVIGPAILNDRRLIWTLDNPFRGRTLLRSLDADRLATWVAEDMESRLGLVAHTVPVVDRLTEEGEEAESPRLSPLARALLVRFGHRDEVRRSLAATLFTGVWRGLESEQIRQQIAMLEGWAQDMDPNVRAWALDLADEHRQRLPRVLMREEEEEV